MTPRPIDQHAIRVPQSSGLAPCLYIPIAARDTDAIETYVGVILARLSPRFPNKALLVKAHEAERPDDRLAIFGLPEAAVLHYPTQVGSCRLQRLPARVHPGISGCRLDWSRSGPCHESTSRASKGLRVFANRTNLQSGELKSWRSI